MWNIQVVLSIKSASLGECLPQKVTFTFQIFPNLLKRDYVPIFTVNVRYWASYKSHLRQDCRRSFQLSWTASQGMFSSKTLSSARALWMKRCLTEAFRLQGVDGDSGMEAPFWGLDMLFLTARACKNGLLAGTPANSPHTHLCWHGMEHRYRKSLDRQQVR